MGTGRRREFDLERSTAGATGVFWQQGYEATSLENLLRAIDLSKSSFYAAYGSKDRLFRTCMQHYCDETLRDLGKSLIDAPSDMQFIRDLFASVTACFGKMRNETPRCFCRRGLCGRFIPVAGVSHLRGKGRA